MFQLYTVFFVVCTTAIPPTNSLAVTTHTQAFTIAPHTDISSSVFTSQIWTHSPLQSTASINGKFSVTAVRSHSIMKSYLFFNCIASEIQSYIYYTSLVFISCGRPCRQHDTCRVIFCNVISSNNSLTVTSNLVILSSPCSHSTWNQPPLSHVSSYELVI